MRVRAIRSSLVASATIHWTSPDSHSATKRIHIVLAGSGARLVTSERGGRHPSSEEDR
jgi:hypothetical protein